MLLLPFSETTKYFVVSGAIAISSSVLISTSDLMTLSVVNPTIFLSSSKNAILAPTLLSNHILLILKLTFLNSLKTQMPTALPV